MNDIAHIILIKTIAIWHRFLLINTLLILPLTASALSPADLSLVGEGRKDFLNKKNIYHAYLYTTKKTKRNNVLKPKTSRCLRLDYFTTIRAKQVENGLLTIFMRQNPRNHLIAIKNNLEKLHKNLKGIKANDRYTVCYSSHTQRLIAKINNTELGRIENAGSFAETYFNVWLKHKACLSPNLRKQLLSGLPL